MKQLIDKSALVAEIKRRLKVHMESNHGFSARYDELKDILSFLDTLKEVDLELNSFDATVCKIGSTYLKEMDKDAITKALEPYKNGDKVKVIIKAQKEE